VKSSVGLAGLKQAQSWPTKKWSKTATGALSVDAGRQVRVPLAGVSEYDTLAMLNASPSSGRPSILEAEAVKSP